MDRLGGSKLRIVAPPPFDAGETGDGADRIRARNEELTVSLRAAEAELRRYRDLFRHSPDGQIVTDTDGTIVEANHASAALLDVGVDRLAGTPVVLFLRDDDGQAKLRTQLGRVHRGSEISGWEVSVQPNDGRPFPATIDVSAEHDAAGRVVNLHWRLRDISDRKRVEEELAFRANHDELTGLPNRGMFQELLALALARARRRDLAVALLYLDLDNFKLVNDTLGHLAGDELLCQVGSRLSEASRETDLVARLGGDEFAILLSDLGRDVGGGERASHGQVLLTTRWVTSRIHDALRAAFSLSGSETFVSASIGVSIFPEDANDDQMLFQHADSAMYRSKQAGPGGTAAVSGQISNEKMTSFGVRLRAAVEERQWVLHYQPIVDLGNGDVVGAEALLRWRRPDGSLTPPGEFIHAAEDMGLIDTIGDWVLEEAARQCRRWSGLGQDLRVAFNASAHQLWDPTFAHRLLSVLEKQDVDPTSIVMEITESAAMGDSDRRVEVLWELHAHGVRLAIDDFGTGYSSLTRLKHLPVDILKIDRSFVRDLPGGPADVSLAAATIQLAHSLGITPLAEGVETISQLEHLEAAGCALAQGFLFGEPAPADEMAPRLGPPADGRGTSP
jgi:diguanylate cyclase (GGDEF)-like protein/PAS domain S-box-containing protein